MHLISLVEDGKFIARLIELINHANSAFIGATSIRILGLLLSHQNSTLSQAVFQAGLLEKYIELIEH